MTFIGTGYIGFGYIGRPGFPDITDEPIRLPTRAIFGRSGSRASVSPHALRSAVVPAVTSAARVAMNPRSRARVGAAGSSATVRANPRSRARVSRQSTTAKLS